MKEIQGLDLKKLDENYVDTIFISGLPMPPTDNRQYKTIVKKSKKARNGYKTLRVKSDSALKYKKQFSDFVLVNAQTFVKARRIVAKWVGTIELELYVAMPEASLLTKNKELKQCDANNRDKAIQDLLAETLRINDTRFNVTRIEKVIAVPKGEQVVAILKPKKLRTLAEVYETLDLRNL